MRTLIRTIGCMVFAALMYSVPIVATCSFLLEWDAFIRLILSTIAVGQLVMMCILVDTTVQKEENE